MGRYRVDIAEKKIIECFQVPRGSYDAALVKQYGSFVHIAPDNLQITAYLCKATSPIEAKIKASVFLNNLRNEML